METREMTCIICPMGCSLRVTREGDSVTVTGNTCKRGEAYGIQELTMPMRTVTTSVLCKSGDRPVVSCKTSAQIPKEKIAAVLAACKSATVRAPLHVGDVLIRNVAGCDSDIVATCNVESTQCK